MRLFADPRDRRFAVQCRFLGGTPVLLSCKAGCGCRGDIDEACLFGEPSSLQSRNHRSGVIRAVSLITPLALGCPAGCGCGCNSKCARVSRQKICILYWLRHLSPQNCKCRAPSRTSTWATVCLTCRHQSHVRLRLNDARRDWEKHSSLQKAPVACAPSVIGRLHQPHHGPPGPLPPPPPPPPESATCIRCNERHVM